MSTHDITAASVEPALLDLPWELPLDAWPSAHIAALPKGISRHLVRFVHLSDGVVAVKETTEELARREYDLLRGLQRIEAPAVEPVAVVTARTDADGTPLPSVLVTRHLRFSMPYRALFAQTLRPDTATRLIDALAVLLARLHVAGFFWGDVSLSNTLFRRDAGAFAAYLVDAETGQLHPDGISSGQRGNDIELARVNVAGELFDLQAAGRLEPGLDPVAVAERVVDTYHRLWGELTEWEAIPATERWRISDRMRRLNDLGFDIGELEMVTDADGTTVRIQPKVVDAGHHQRRLLRLTGLDTQENQARRLLNDLDSYVATYGRPEQGEEVLAHEWLTRVFEPVVRAIPRDLRGKLEPAEVFHQLLDHRWYLSQAQQRDVPLAEAVTSYVGDVLRHRRDEAALFNPPTGTITLPIETISSGPSTDELRALPPDDDIEDWRLKV